MLSETSKYYIFPSSEFTAPDGKTFNKWEVNGKTYKVGDTLTLTQDIIVKATWKNKSTSSGGGGGSSTPSYKITTKIEDGTITPANISVKKNENQKLVFKANDGFEITDVLVDGKSIGIVNDYTFTKVTEKHTVEVKTKKIVLTDTENTENTENIEDGSKTAEEFNDVSKDSWYYGSIDAAVKKGLFSGVSKNKFAPDQNVTRGMLVTILAKLDNAKTEKDVEDIVNSSVDIKEEMPNTNINDAFSLDIDLDNNQTPQVENIDSILEENVPLDTAESDSVIGLDSILSTPALNEINTDELVIPEVNSIDNMDESKMRIIYEKDVPNNLLRDIYSSSKIMPALYDYLEGKSVMEGGLINE